MRSAPTQLCGDRDVACGGSSRRAESSSIAARTFDTGPCERKNWNYRRDRDRSERSAHPSPGTESSGIDHPRSRSPEGWQTLFFDGAVAALASRQRLATALPMPGYTDPVDLAARLIRCPSITPARGEVFDVLEQALAPLDFEIHRWTMGDAPDGPTENMVAIRGSGSPHFGFAGHLEVVPPGEGWSVDPFDGLIHDGLLVGRGANDMKSAIAAFV